MALATLKLHLVLMFIRCATSTSTFVPPIRRADSTVPPLRTASRRLFSSLTSTDTSKDYKLASTDWAWNALLISSFSQGIVGSKSVQLLLKQVLLSAWAANNNNNNKDNSDETHLRVVYIPTALYALRLDSDTSPGKQRQRAKADGRKRRTIITNLLQQLLHEDSENHTQQKPSKPIQILAISLDLDDGSIQHPEGSSDTTHFPTPNTCISQWNPHLIYVEGGNTFWLHHCIQKGAWKDSLKHIITTPNTVYIGTSAGAILAGATVSPATWKQWDDPTVVPGMEHYEDWHSGIPGWNVAGGASFFPHMTPEWEPVVATRRETMTMNVHCLADDDVCWINGTQRNLTILRGNKIGGESDEVTRSPGNNW